MTRRWSIATWQFGNAAGELMAQISLFGLGQAAKSPFVTAKQMTNLYAEVRPAGEKSALVAYGTPGLSAPLVDFGATPIRGGREFPSLFVCFVVHRGILWEVNNAGVATNRGTLLTTTGRVSMSDNGVQVMIVDGTYGYIYNTSTNVFAQVTDADFPASGVGLSATSTARAGSTARTWITGCRGMRSTLPTPRQTRIRSSPSGHRTASSRCWAVRPPNTGGCLVRWISRSR